MTVPQPQTPIPAFASATPPDQALEHMLARAERLGIAPERILLALGHQLPDASSEKP